MSAVVIGAMSTDDRAYPHTALVLTFKIEKRQTFAVRGSIHGSTSIHECFRIDTATAEQALWENAITIKGKGGKIRTVPINEQIAIAMRKQLDRTQRGHKLLVPDGMLTDLAINLLQLFIMKHRDEVRDTDSDRPLTYHGLRHFFAAEKYKERVGSGMSPLDAHFTVSRLLGHERPDVTRIYLASLR